MDDITIVEKYFSRDESAITDTDAKYGKYLIKIAYNILFSENDSEEALNDTYLAAWNSIPPQRPVVLRPYLSKLTRRISIDKLKYHSAAKRGTEYKLSLEELAECIPGGASPESALDAKLVGEAIGDFLRSLPEKARIGFVRRYFFLDSIEDTAASLGITKSELKSLMYRTRLKLREHLEKEGIIV